MGLFEELRALSEQIKKRATVVKGEEATKQALILPFLSVLGYDVYDPTELQPEYSSDFAKTGTKEKVDYAIFIKGAPAIFIEAKAVGSAPEDHQGQLSRYFNATPSVKTGIITNGVLYHFFTDLQEPNIMGEKPFFSFDMLGFTERDVDTLRLFTKDVYDPAALRDLAEEIIYVGKLTGLVGDILRSPSEGFVKFLLGEANFAGRLTAKVVERFIPVVRKAIQTNLLEMATRSIRLETEVPQLAVVTPIASASAAPEYTPIVNEKDPRIITTAEELEAIELVKKWVAESSQVAKYPITHKDSISHLGFHLQASSLAWFLRLHTDQKRKFLVTRLPVEAAKMLAPGFEVETYTSNSALSRLFIVSVKDIEKLRSLVIYAYEDAIKRRESGKDEGSGSASA